MIVGILIAWLNFEGAQFALHAAGITLKSYARSKKQQHRQAVRFYCKVFNSLSGKEDMVGCSSKDWLKQILRE